MDKVIKNHLALIAVLLIGSFQVLAAVEAKPVYLSYEEKVLVGYALLADGKDSTAQAVIAARAGHFISQNLAKPVTVEVRNFQEFLDHSRGEWPNSGSLEGDLQRIESLGVRGRITYTSRSLSVQRKIEAYQQSHLKFLISWGSAITQGDPALAVERAQNLVREQLENFNRIGEKVASVGMAGMKDVTSRIVLQTLFTEYYARQSVDSKKQMIMAMLNANLLMNDEAKLELMIQNSGPQFQKLLQVVARQGELPQELQSTFKKLESAVRAEPWWKVQEILAHEKANYTFTYFERKPLGVGTMAQVHRAKVLWNGQIRDVVARFIKPGIDLKVAEDHRILTEVSKIVDQNAEYRRNHGPLMTPLVQSIT
ncbi:MAG: AarF/ABC1/UbiB kinase family protein, partial [Proteobacteria bacterium]